MHPLTVQIITRDSVERREVLREYVVRTKHPRWELLKIAVHALFHIEYR